MKKYSVKALLSLLRREELYLLLFSFGLMYQCLNKAIPSRKCSINPPAINEETLVYVLTEICHERSKWLGPKFTWGLPDTQHYECTSYRPSGNSIVKGETPTQSSDDNKKRWSLLYGPHLYYFLLDLQTIHSSFCKPFTR